MRVLSVLAVLVAVAHAGDIIRNNGGLVSSGSNAGRYDNNLVQNTNSYVAPLSSGNSISSGNFVDGVFSGNTGGDGNNQFGGVFGGNNVFGGNALRTGQSLGGDIFGNAGTISPQSFNATGGRQRGTVQASILDQAGERSDRRDDTSVRDAAQKEQSAARRDQQLRQGDSREAEQERNQYQEEQRGQDKRENYKQQAGRWNLDSRRQNDQYARRGVGIAEEGELARSDVVANDGAKALGVRKAAFTNGDLGFEDINYNFDKDFDQVANERGGYKEVTGRDNNNVQVYREKQRDHRFSNSDNEAYKNADDLSRNAKSQEWLQNALQKQGQNNQYGAADKLQDAAAKQAEDFKTFFDKRDDRIWNADRAKDAAFRGAEDIAAKNGLYNKDAIARAAGKKGVADNKYYGGIETDGGRGGPIGYNRAGVTDYGPGGVAGSPNYDDSIGLQGSAVESVAGLRGPAGNTKGRVESSGGDVVNAYNENAVQGDLANQVSNNAAESNANAANQYLRDKGLEDSVQQDQSNQGRWVNQREGFRDAREQGYNGDNAEAARAGEALDNAYADSQSHSNLEAANKNFDQAKLDRINLKSNKVDSNQNIRSKKQFYHDKNQGGYNNEGLNYSRRRGNNDFGAQEAAQKEARNRFSNLHQDNKNSLSRRKFEDQDARRLSNGDAVYKQHNANNGDAEAFALANENGRLNAQGFNKNKAVQEYDTFNQQNFQQNQKLWDRANRDFNSRNKGNNVGRQTDAGFVYANDGFNGDRTAFSQQGPAFNRLGSSNFGQSNLGVDGGFYSSGNSGAPGRRVVAGNAGNNVYGNNALTAGSTQFGKYW